MKIAELLPMEVYLLTLRSMLLVTNSSVFQAGVSKRQPFQKLTQR